MIPTVTMWWYTPCAVRTLDGTVLVYREVLLGELRLRAGQPWPIDQSTVCKVALRYNSGYCSAAPQAAEQ